MKFKRDIKGLVSLVVLSIAPVVYYLNRDKIYQMVD